MEKTIELSETFFNSPDSFDPVGKLIKLEKFSCERETEARRISKILA